MEEVAFSCVDGSRKASHLVAHDVQQVIQRQEGTVRLPNHQLNHFTMVPIPSSDCARSQQEDEGPGGRLTLLQ
jgi:hypothetical protein